MTGSAMLPCSIRMAECHDFVIVLNGFDGFLSIWSTALALSGKA